MGFVLICFGLGLFCDFWMSRYKGNVRCWVRVLVVLVVKVFVVSLLGWRS